MVAIRMQSKTIWPGLSAAVSGTATPSQQQKKTNSVEHVAAAEDRAFAAAKDDGSFISWRRADSRGDSHTVQGQVTSGVRQVVGNWEACAAVKGDGSVVTCRWWKKFSLHTTCQLKTSDILCVVHSVAHLTRRSGCTGPSVFPRNVHIFPLPRRALFTSTAPPELPRCLARPRPLRAHAEPPTQQTEPTHPPAEVTKPTTNPTLHGTSDSSATAS